VRYPRGYLLWSLPLNRWTGRASHACHYPRIPIFSQHFHFTVRIPEWCYLFIVPVLPIALSWSLPYNGRRLTIYGGPSSRRILWFLLSSSFQTLYVYPNGRGRAACGVRRVFDFHRTRPRFVDTQNRTRTETWCLIGTFPKAKLSTQLRFFGTLWNRINEMKWTKRAAGSMDHRRTPWHTA